MIAASIGIWLAWYGLSAWVESDVPEGEDSELRSNVQMIWTMEIAYGYANGHYLAAENAQDLKALGWSPSGSLQGNYSVTTTSGIPGDFRARGSGDLDGDGVYTVYVATKSQGATLLVEADSGLSE